MHEHKSKPVFSFNKSNEYSVYPYIPQCAGAELFYESRRSRQLRYARALLKTIYMGHGMFRNFICARPSRNCFQAIFPQLLFFCSTSLPRWWTWSWMSAQEFFAHLLSLFLWVCVRTLMSKVKVRETSLPEIKEEKKNVFAAPVVMARLTAAITSSVKASLLRFPFSPAEKERKKESLPARYITEFELGLKKGKNEKTRSGRLIVLCFLLSQSNKWKPKLITHSPWPWV